MSGAKQRSGFEFARAFGGRLWQRNFFDRTIRKNEDIPALIAYIVNNPVRARLVIEPADYPHWGSQVYTREEILAFVGSWRRRGLKPRPPSRHVSFHPEWRSRLQPRRTNDAITPRPRAATVSLPLRTRQPTACSPPRCSAAPGASFTNNGTLTGTAASSGLYFLGTGAALRMYGPEEPAAEAEKFTGLAQPVTGYVNEGWPTRAAQSYSGSGTVCTAPLTALEIDNPSGVTMSAGLVTARVNLLRGTLANSDLVTIGNGGATSGTTQIGFAGNTGSGGSFGAAPTFGYGTGGYSAIYAQEGSGRTTGYEIPSGRSIASMTVNNTNGVTLAGGGLTVTSGLTLSSGNVTTNANVLAISSSGAVTRTSGHVVGNLQKNVATGSSVARNFEVGTGSDYAPYQLSLAR